METKWTTRLSIRQWVCLALSVGMVIILGTLIFSTVYASEKLENESAVQYQSILDMRRVSLDNSLASASAALVSYHFFGSHMSDLLNADNGNAGYLATTNVSGDLNTQILRSTIAEVAFVRKQTDSFDNFKIVLSSSSHFTTQEKLDVERYVSTMDITQAGTDFSWKPCRIGEEWYMVYIIANSHYVIGQGIRAKTIVELYAMLMDDNSAIILLDDNGERMVEVPESVSRNLEISNDRQGTGKTDIQGNKLVVSSYSTSLQRPVFFVKHGLVSRQFENIIRLLQLSCVVIFVVYLLTFNNVARAVLRPIKDLGGCIEKIRDGNLETRITMDSKVPRDFLSVYRTLNEMTERIQTLKIDSYESELRRKQYEIQFLTLQIEPHFYQNSLKYVYALAQTKQYDKVQTIALALSGYFRYLTYDSGKKASLQQELEHVGYYLDIVNAGSANHVHASIHVDPETEQAPVPKLLVQTFVENAVKHGTAKQKDLNIDIDVRCFNEEGAQYLRLQVRDDGCGFPAEYIERIKQEGFESSKGHVGLSNLYCRLQLLYPEGQTFMAVRNNENGGATAEIIMPVLGEETMEEQGRR